jgi:hypothetical protein
MSSGHSVRLCSAANHQVYCRVHPQSSMPIHSNVLQLLLLLLLIPLLLPTTICCLSLPFPNDERFITLFPLVTECWLSHRTAFHPLDDRESGMSSGPLLSGSGLWFLLFSPQCICVWGVELLNKHEKEFNLKGGLWL